MTRLGILMRPEPGNALESEGVLNPASTWGSDGRLYLYPRLVAQGNVSRIGRVEVILDRSVPVGVRRDGVALEPDRSWEHGASHGGVEDPRITPLAGLDLHVMTYVAFGPLGPRPAVALSSNGRDWERLGPILFGYEDGLEVDLNLYPNKDVVFFPEVVPAPDGRPSYALLHRPMWDFSFARVGEPALAPAGMSDRRASIWISYVDATLVHQDIKALTRPHSHRFLAGPREPWEALKIGAGPAPLRVAEGWLLIYHGVSGQIDANGSFMPQSAVRYCVGAMLLDPADPSRVLARTSQPLLEPLTAEETAGQVANVVFPTAIERIGGQTYVFYGMADSQVGLARLDHIPN
jgi:predicted GH43/DUF377 family glycosyl hydrolase